MCGDPKFKTHPIFHDNFWGSFRNLQRCSRFCKIKIFPLALWKFPNLAAWLLPCKDSKSTRLVQRLSNTRCLANLLRTRFSSSQLVTTARHTNLKQNRKLPIKKILQWLWQMSFKITLSHASCYCTA